MQITFCMNASRLLILGAIFSLDFESQYNLNFDVILPYHLISSLSRKPWQDSVESSSTAPPGAAGMKLRRHLAALCHTMSRPQLPLDSGLRPDKHRL